MSLRADAGYSLLLLRNSDRLNANPPIVFPGISTDVNQHFSYSFWTRVRNNIPTIMIYHECTDGSFMRISTDGFVWRVEGRNGVVGLPTFNIGQIFQDRWTLICVTKNGSRVNVYIGIEGGLASQPWLNPVGITLGTEFDYNIYSEFATFGVAIPSNIEVCCFKFWNHTLTKDEIQTQANRWDAVGVPVPMWVSPLRTAGDISNIANPSSSPYWNQNFSYNEIVQPANIVTAGIPGQWNDPAYLSNSQPCPTWIYPIGVNPAISVDPGLTPLVQTTYKGTQFYRFRDVGSVPIVDFQIQSIKYYGNPVSGPDTGGRVNDTWGLYKDENGIEVSDTSGPQFRFESNSGVTIPGSIKASTMYRWQFGAQFTWLPYTPQQPTMTANLNNIFLFVTYIGFPTGVIFIPEVDLSGLFAIYKRDVASDSYNNGVSLKIPDPTVQTAYIGE